MSIDKYTDEQEKKDIEMFLTKVDELHEFDDTIDVSSILEYFKSIYKSIDEDDLGKAISQHDPSKISDEMLHVTGLIAREIACNAINDVDSHTTTLSVIKILCKFSWEDKFILTIASFMLTYGNNGPDLCPESNVVASDLLDFSKKLIGVGCWIYENRMVLAAYSKSNDPISKEATKIYQIFYYSTIRVVVVAASSQLMTLSCRADSFRFGTSSSNLTWCFKKLEDINRQRNSEAGRLNVKFSGLSFYELQKNENAHEVKYQIRMPVTPPESIDINVVGHNLVIKYTDFKGDPAEKDIELDKNLYRYESITAEWDKHLLSIIVPKRNTSEPERLHIPLTIIS